ncbi:MAG: DMT family transporter [Terrimicrobiaceae bacterium]
MGAALLTVFLFACSGIAGERAARYWGGQLANLLRLMLATLILATGTLIFFPGSLRWETFGWLFLSGMVGFGLGDIALFLAYVRIGARLTILLNLCTAPLWSSFAEWVWLGTKLTPGQMAAGAIILCGVIMAILSRPPTSLEAKGAGWFGILCGLMAGMGQGIGAVISRNAFELAAHGGFAINGFSAAAQRVSGGLLTVLVLVIILSAVGNRLIRPAATATRSKAFAWLFATAICGPVLGVSCFQWSLILLPSGLASAVVAMTPIAMIPMAMLIDRERPRALSVAGACVAVAGVVWLLQMAR